MGKKPSERGRQQNNLGHQSSTGQATEQLHIGKKKIRKYLKKKQPAAGYNQHRRKTNVPRSPKDKDQGFTHDYEAFLRG